MNICLLTPRFPFPENGGDVLRINNIARYLKKKGHRLVLFSFKEKNISNEAFCDAFSLYDEVITVKRNRLVSLFYSTIFFFLGRPIQCGYYYSPVFKKKFSKYVETNNLDLFISHLLRMTQYLENDRFINKSIVEMTDALSKTYSLSEKNKTKSYKSFIYKIEKKLIEKYEKKIIGIFPKVVLVSQKDIDYLGLKKNLKLYTNGIDVIEESKPIDKNKICFVGNMRTVQNQDAVLYFVKEILPIIKKELPSIQFYIVGAEPSENIKRLENEKDVHVTGFVDSITDYISDSCLMVAPIRIAAGIQNKVLVGMACHIPVILSSMIAGSIPELITENNCIIEDDANRFAKKCIELICKPEKRKMIAENGFNVVRNNYDWTKKLNGYEYFD